MFERRDELPMQIEPWLHGRESVLATHRFIRASRTPPLTSHETAIRSACAASVRAWASLVRDRRLPNVSTRKLITGAIAQADDPDTPGR
jgi:hypothetical protein